MEPAKRRTTTKPRGVYRTHLGSPPTLDTADVPAFCVSLVMPWPPSMNHYWRSIHSGPLAGRVLLSAEGRAYRQRVAIAVMMQRVPRLEVAQSLEVDIETNEPLPRRRRDLDNMLKPILDGLTHARVIADDCWIDRLTISRGRPLEGGRISIIVRALVPTP